MAIVREIIGPVAVGRADREPRNQRAVANGY